MDQKSKIQEPVKQVENEVSVLTVSSEIKVQDYPCKQTRSRKFACITRSCTHYAFLCIDEECPCQTLHKDCLVVKAECVAANLEKRIIPYQPIEDSINQKVENSIDLLSDHRDKLNASIRQNLECFGLTEWEKKVYKMMRNKEKSEITGHELWQLQLNFKSLQISKQILQKRSDQIHQLFSALQGEIAKVFQQAINVMVEFKKSAQNYLLKRQQILTQAYLNISDFQDFQHGKKYQRVFDNSNILTNITEIQKVKNFLKPKQLNSAKLLYRASDHNFQISKFHENCDSHLNTIILCTNQFDKKLGGFTCLDWKQYSSSSSNYYKSQTISYNREDSQFRSFVFSLTNNHKFTLRNSSKTIYCRKDAGPCFGQEFFWINNDSKQKKASWINVNKQQQYYNSNYKANDKNSSIMLSGSEDGKFAIKEWQVWHLEFK